MGPKKKPQPRKRKATPASASVANDVDDERTEESDRGHDTRADIDTEEEGGDATDDIRLIRSCVHDEFVQTSEKGEVTTKTGKKRKIVNWSSACKHCDKVYQHKKQYALKRHLESKHPDRAKIAEDKDDLNREAQKANKNNPTVDKKLLVMDKYTNWVINSGAPLNTSDNEHFKEFVATLDPTITIPGRHAVTNFLDKKYQDMMLRLKARLEDARRCHLTMDGWSNRRCRSSFLGATVHFFNQKKRKTENFRLCLRKFEMKHTATNIMAMTQSILNEFGIRHKTQAILTDNGASMRRSVIDLSQVELKTPEVDMNMNTEQGTFANEVEDEFLPEVLSADDQPELPLLEAGDADTDEEREDEERNRLIQELEDEVSNFTIARRLYDLNPLRCLAHLLQLPILKVLRKDHKDNVFSDLLTKVRRMVGKYSKSVYAKEELYKLVELLVVTYVVTRWWSDVDMMERLRRINKINNNALNSVITDCDWDEDLKLSKKDFQLLDKFVELFKPIKKMSDLLNGETYSTIHLVLPTVREIKSHIDSFKKDKLVGVLAKTLSKEFENYFG